MDRFYVDTSGGRGWAKVHVLMDRSTVPHTAVRSHGRWNMAKRATVVKACAELNQTTDVWHTAPGGDSLVRLREWAAKTRAFTATAYDPALDENPDAIAALYQVAA